MTPYPEYLTPSLSHHCSSSIYFCSHTHMHTLSHPLTFVSMALLEGQWCRRQAETSQTCYIHWVVDLCQSQRRVHLALFGHTLALICKAVKGALRRSRKRGRCFLASIASLCSLTFMGYWPALLRFLGGAINGRKCPWCGYKRTSAPRREDDSNLRQRQVTEI